MDGFDELVRIARSIRRFDESFPVSYEQLLELVDVARLSPSAGNLQPLKYKLICDAEGCARVFPHLRWAGRLKNWPGPAEGERPTGYIVILHDTAITAEILCDHGVAAAALVYAAAARGLGACIIGSIDRPALAQALGIEARFEIMLVFAVGRPGEVVVLEECPPGGDVAYWRDENGVHHVPKRPLSEIVL